MMDKNSKQRYVEIMSITFQNDDPINGQLEGTGKMLVALQPKYPLNYFVYPISEANSPTLFNSLILLKQNM